MRPRRGTWADTVAERLKELKLEHATIGMDGLAGPLDPDGWLPYSVYEDIKAALPGVTFVDLGDLMETMRSVKSDEEIGMLEQAAALGDNMLQACRDIARPGVKESEVYAGMMQAMLAEGGEEPTLFLWACDQYPFPHPFRVPPPARWWRMTSSPAKSIPRSAATSPMSSAPSASASPTPSRAASTMSVLPPMSAG